MGWYDYYIGATGLSPEEARTPQNDQYTLRAYTDLADARVSLAKQQMSDQVKYNIAQLKADMKSRSDLMAALTDLSEANVRDRDSMRSAAARVESALASQLRDIQRPGYQTDGAIVGLISRVRREGGTTAAMQEMFVDGNLYGDGSTASTRLRGKPEKMVSTWREIVKNTNGGLQIDGEGNLIINEGRITEDSSLTARINAFHDQWKKYKATSDAQRASIEGRMNELRALQTKIDEDTDGKLGLENIRGSIYGIATDAQTKINDVYGYKGEKVAEQVGEYDRRNALVQTMDDKMRRLDAGDPTALTPDRYKQFVGNEDVQAWARDKGYDFGFVDEVSGQYFPGKDDELALRMWGVEISSKGKRKWFERGSSGQTVKIYRELSDEEIAARKVPGKGYPVNEDGELVAPDSPVWSDPGDKPQVFQWTLVMPAEAEGAEPKTVRSYVFDDQVYTRGSEGEFIRTGVTPADLKDYGYAADGAVVITDSDEDMPGIPSGERYLKLEDLDDPDVANLRNDLRVGMPAREGITYVDELLPDQREEFVDEGVRAPLNAYRVIQDGSGGVELRNGRYYPTGVKAKVVGYTPAGKFRNRPRYFKEFVRRLDIKRARDTETEGRPLMTEQRGGTVFEYYVTPRTPVSSDMVPVKEEVKVGDTVGFEGEDLPPEVVEVAPPTAEEIEEIYGEEGPPKTAKEKQTEGRPLTAGRGAPRERITPSLPPGTPRQDAVTGKGESIAEAKARRLLEEPVGTAGVFQSRPDVFVGDITETEKPDPSTELGKKLLAAAHNEPAPVKSEDDAKPYPFYRPTLQELFQARSRVDDSVKGPLAQAEDVEIEGIDTDYAEGDGKGDAPQPAAVAQRKAPPPMEAAKTPPGPGVEPPPVEKGMEPGEFLKDVKMPTESAEQIIARSQAEDEEEKKKAAPVEKKAETEEEPWYQRMLAGLGNIRKGTNKRKSAQNNKKDNKDEDAVAVGE